MLRDRGLLKWLPAHFMPEHRKMLSDVDWNQYQQKKPELDEQQFEEIGIIVMESLHYTLEIRISVWKAGYFYDHKGIVNKVDYQMKYILLDKEDGEIRILINDIKAVERI